MAELGGYVDARPDLVTWRQGRCLPYGEGITFWALGEILKAHTGILESDPPDVARTKLDACCPKGRSGRGSASASCRCLASRRRRPQSGRSCSPPGADSWNRSRTSARRCWCSRTCTGRTRRCSRSSSTSPTSPRACRCSSSPPPARSSTSATPSTRRGFGTRHRSTWLRCRRRRPPGSCRRCWTRRCFRSRCSARSSTGQTATRSTPRSSSGCSRTATCSSGPARAGS